MSRKLLLAGVSALAMLVCAEASAETFVMPGKFSFTAPVSGEYAIDVLGASGGNGVFGGAGLGAEVTGDVLLQAGQDLTLYVGGRGQSLAGAGSFTGGGGGGGSFVFLGTNVLAVAGGGGGASYDSVIGGPGLAGTSGGAGGGVAGGTAGASGNGGGAGTFIDGSGYGANGGGGAGVNSGAVGYGGDGAAGGSGYGGKFPSGGAGSYGYGNAGGFGGGGGGGDQAGGGGSGFSGGGGGGGGVFGGYGGGGGGSYLSSLVTAQVLTAGVNSGDGSISIDLIPPAVPEPSTWAMTLVGFAGLGWLARMRRRKPSPA